jgi:cardiolipin synthase
VARAFSFRSLILLFAALATAGCATSKLENPPPASAPPPILSAKGPLGEQAAERLLDSRLGGQDDDPRLRELIESFRQAAAAPLVAGNRCTLLIDGPQTITAMRKALEGAQHNVNLETYIFADDDVGRAFRDLL